MPNEASRLVEGQTSAGAAIYWPALSADADQSNAQTEMEFLATPPHAPRQIFGDMWRIFGSGPTDPRAGARLSQLVAQKGIPARSTLYLHSPGGSLVGGLALGRAIRIAGLNTYIGQAGDEEIIGRFKSRKVKPGRCYSAGTLAFLGGVFRWGAEGFEYGVHRFYADRDPGSDAAQTISAMVVDYIKEMGVDPALFTEMSKAGRDEINILSEDVLTRLKVINGASHRTVWSIESFGEGLYLKGERITWRGINKFILLHTPKGGTILHAIFDPEGRGEEATQMGAHSLFVDDKTHPIEASLKAHLVNGLVNIVYDLDSNLIDKIKRATTVGIALQWVYGAPMFLGFSGMEIGEGRSKLLGYLALRDVQRQ